MVLPLAFEAPLVLPKGRQAGLDALTLRLVPINRRDSIRHLTLRYSSLRGNVALR
jgi:hypothetical protein